MSGDPGAVIAFWRKAGPGRWFAKDTTFDAEFRHHFLADHLAAARGEHGGWRGSAEGSLALLLLLDQFPRNAFRGTSRMYATDGLALPVARGALAAGHDRALEKGLRLFFYLPFAHAEDLDDQALSVRLNAGLGNPWDQHALGHYEIIRRFGRFPHRNALLGRETTEEEAHFLRNGGFSG